MACRVRVGAMIREICKKCHNKHYMWSASDETRWDDHELVLCPPQLASTDNAGKQKEDQDHRISRSVEGNDDIPEWCPYKTEHAKVARRRRRGRKSHQDPLGPH